MNRGAAAATLALVLLVTAPVRVPSAKTSGAAGTSRSDGARLSDVTAALDRRIPDLLAEGLVPGLSIALVRDGKIAWAKAFGVANADTRQPVTTETVFEAASLSKPVFAYAVLKLVDRGLLNLDTPLTRYLPGRYDVGDDPRLDLITARLVLSHRTGFPNWRQGPRDQAPLSLYFTPGERFSYSGEGYVYLAHVVEHVTGQPLEAFMQASVFDPLGMTSSSYVWQDRYETRKAYNHDVFGRVTGRSKPTKPNAAASLHTTPADLARFVVAVLDGRGLAPATARAMLSVESRVSEGGPNTIARGPGHLSPSLAWGLGWGLLQTPRGPAFWHWGDNGNNRSFVYASERSKNAVVIQTNGANGMLIVPALVRIAVGDADPVFGWLDYGTLASPAHRLITAIVSRGSHAALADYREHRASQRVPEEQVNAIGYALLRSKRVDEAIEVFTVNVEDHPDSFNAHDSLGEAYAVKGNRELAIKHYERSVELNPDNRNGIEALKKLRGGQSLTPDAPGPTCRASMPPREARGRSPREEEAPCEAVEAISPGGSFSARLPSACRSCRPPARWRSRRRPGRCFPAPRGRASRSRRQSAIPRRGCARSAAGYRRSTRPPSSCRWGADRSSSTATCPG